MFFIIIINETDGRNIVFTRITRHSGIFILHKPFNAKGTHLCTVSRLRLVGVKVGWEDYLRLRYHIQVTLTTYSDLYGHYLIGFGGCIVNCGLNFKLANTTRETYWFISKGIHLDMKCLGGDDTFVVDLA